MQTQEFQPGETRKVARLEAAYARVMDVIKIQFEDRRQVRGGDVGAVTHAGYRTHDGIPYLTGSIADARRRRLGLSWNGQRQRQRPEEEQARRVEASEWRRSPTAVAVGRRGRAQDPQSRVDRSCRPVQAAARMVAARVERTAGKDLGRPGPTEGPACTRLGSRGW